MPGVDAMITGGYYVDLVAFFYKPFGKWSEIMSDDAIATATLDRLLHHAHVVSLKGDSYRMKDRLKTGVVDSLG